MLIPLHVKSHHSWGAGTASPEQLVARAAQFGLSALALTDIDNLSGQPRFHALCEAAGIRPIVGVELRPLDRGDRRGGRIVVLAKDAEGYASLGRIVSLRRGGAGSERARELARDPVAALGPAVRGVFVLTDDPATLERLLGAGSVDRADLRLLLVRPSDCDERLVREAAARLGVAMVADPEVALLDADDWRFHGLLVAALRNQRVRDLAAADLESPERWFRAPSAQLALFADVPDAVEETVRIAERCRFRLARGRPVVPGAEAFGGAPELVLDRRCRRALNEARARGRCRASMYTQRLTTELTVIAELGYAGYFLAAAEVADAAGARDIAISARGSAVASLVVHLLGISAIDPVAHGLHFERFLHARRASPPDIDLDVGSDRRDELLRWVFRRFGRARVALVGTLPTFQFDSAIRSGLKALGASPKEIERFVAAVARSGAQAENEPKRVPAEALRCLPSALREGLPLIARLIGKPRSLAMHPGGIVIADRAITDYVPVELGRAGLVVAHYDQRSIEQTGLTKLDVLGNRFLSQLQRARVLSDNAAPRLHEAALDDPATLARIDRADTLGCFQIETPLLRSVLTQIPVRSLDDCVAALALVRPGAAAGAAKRDYLRFVAGGADRPPLYDEDLMELLSSSAGISLAEADELRTRIIDCADPGELAEHGRAYVRLAASNRRDPKHAGAAWQRAVQFAAYSFCKAHAWSHALLAYQSAYLETHHLVEFGCALVDSYGGAYPLRTIAADLQRSGAEIGLPSVNDSMLASTIGAANPRMIQLGLARIKHLSKKSAAAILELRAARGDFLTIEDLTSQIRLAPRELRALVLSGACDQLAGLSADAYPFAHEALLRGLGLAADSDRARAPSPDADPRRMADYRNLVRVRHELEFLDMHVSAHPLRVLRNEATRYGCVTAAAAKGEIEPGAVIRFAGLIAASRRHRIGSGGVIDYMTFEDESGLVDAVLSTRGFSRLAPVLTTPGPYLGEGRLHDEHGHRYVELSSLWPFYERHRMAVSRG